MYSFVTNCFFRNRIHEESITQLTIYNSIYLKLSKFRSPYTTQLWITFVVKQNLLSGHNQGFTVTNKYIYISPYWPQGTKLTGVIEEERGRCPLEFIDISMQTLLNLSSSVGWNANLTSVVKKVGKAAGMGHK